MALAPRDLCRVSRGKRGRIGPRSTGVLRKPRLLLPAKSKDNIGHCTFEVLVVVVVEVMVGEYQMSDELRVFFLFIVDRDG